MLTDTAIRKAKPTDKQQKLADSGGMYLLLKPDDSRYWRMDYRHGGKRKTLALGVYLPLLLPMPASVVSMPAGYWQTAQTQARRGSRPSGKPRRPSRPQAIPSRPWRANGWHGRTWPK